MSVMDRNEKTMRDDDGSVLTCTVEGCAYNEELECLAPSIHVGGGDHPACDTFTRQQGVQKAQRESVVSACEIGECTFNSQMHCEARGITVDHHAEHADCVTFRP
jgi:hypothetical protein